MQRRAAALRGGAAPRILSRAVFVPELAPLPPEGGELRFAPHCSEACAAAWPVQRFLSLLLGEIPRLRDAPGGYGPLGAGFICHVDIPAEVEAAWAHLAARFPDLVRA